MSNDMGGHETGSGEHMSPTCEGVAPGWPGIPPRWTSSAKEGVGTSASYQSRVWFTISHGILNEVYYPRIDQANTRDMEFLVADGDRYFSEEKRDTLRRISPLEQGVPAYKLVNSCKKGRYRLTKTVITDPETMDGLAATRAFQCFSLRGKAQPSPWLARRRSRG